MTTPSLPELLIALDRVAAELEASQVPALLGGLLDLLHEVCEWDEALDGDGA